MVCSFRELVCVSALGCARLGETKATKDGNFHFAWENICSFDSMPRGVWKISGPHKVLEIEALVDFPLAYNSVSFAFGPPA